MTYDAPGPEVTLAQVPQHRDDPHPDALLAQMHLPENDLAQDAPGPEVTFAQRGPCPEWPSPRRPARPDALAHDAPWSDVNLTQPAPARTCPCPDAIAKLLGLEMPHRR